MIESTDGRRALFGPKYQLKEIRARHQLIMQLQLAGISQVKIAAALNMTAQQVCNVQNSDMYRAAFAKMQELTANKVIDRVVGIRERIEKMAGTSLDVLDEILKDDMAENKVKADIAFDILDRSGYGAPQRVEHTLNWDQKIGEAWEERKRRKQVAESVIDVTPGIPILEELTAGSAPPGEQDEDPDNDTELLASNER